MSDEIEPRHRLVRQVCNAVVMHRYGNPESETPHWKTLDDVAAESPTLAWMIQSEAQAIVDSLGATAKTAKVLAEIYRARRQAWITYKGDPDDARHIYTPRLIQDADALAAAVLDG